MENKFGYVVEIRDGTTKCFEDHDKPLYATWGIILRLKIRDVNSNARSLWPIFHVFF